VWFIPVVNIWMSYQAIRDLLPPTHPFRPWLWRAWVLIILSGFVGAAGFFLLFASEAVGVTVLAVAGVMVLTFAWMGRRVLQAIAADHAGVIAGGSATHS
jgi:hypothetical protein